MPTWISPYGVSRMISDDRLSAEDLVHFMNARVDEIYGLDDDWTLSETERRELREKTQKKREAEALERLRKEEEKREMEKKLFSYDAYYAEILGETDLLAAVKDNPAMDLDCYTSPFRDIRLKWRNHSWHSDTPKFKWYNDEVQAFFNKIYYEDVRDEAYLWKDDRRVFFISGFSFQIFLRFALPSKGENDPLKIAVFKDVDKFQRDIRTAMKPGKVIQWIFPTLKPNRVEYWANQWKENYTPKDWEFRIQEDGFAKVYTSEMVDTNNPHCTPIKKLLCCSCMRYDFEYGGHHPVDAYETGDFLLASLWTKGDKPKLVARTLVYKKNKCYAPIYVTNDACYDLMVSKLQELGYEAAAHDYLSKGKNWIGAKLKKIDFDGDGWVLPYLDLSPRYVRDEGDHFIISTNGDWEASSAEGLVRTGETAICYQCDDHIDPEYAYSDRHGTVFCENCYSEQYTTCAHCDDEEVNADLTTTVTSRCLWSGLNREQWCNHCVVQNAVYVESEGEHYNEDLTVQLENGYYALTSEEGSTWSICVISGERYLLEELEVTTNGSYVHPLNVDDTKWVKNENGEWEEKEAA